MTRKKLLLLIFALPAVLGSCGTGTVGNGVTIPYVEKMLSDTNSSSWKLVSQFNPRNPQGSITVIGDFDGSMVMGEHLMNSDMFNNVNGQSSPDFLPDFAGEEVSVMADITNAPYSGYIFSGNAEYLKELTVRNILTALDTLAGLNPADIELSSRKDRAKVIVLSSPYQAAYGLDDVDTLFRKAGRPSPVISAQVEMLRRAYAVHGAEAAVGVWTTYDVEDNGLYGIISRRISPAPLRKVFAAKPDSAGVKEALCNFLEQFRESGGNRLSVLLLDDPAVDPAAVRFAAERSKLGGYADFLAEDFEVIDPYSTVCEACFRYLRSNNAFTHRVAYPDAEFYITYPVPNLAAEAYKADGQFTDKFKFERAPDLGSDTYVLMEMRSRYLDSRMVDDIDNKFPVLTYGYVR